MDRDVEGEVVDSDSEPESHGRVRTAERVQTEKRTRRECSNGREVQAIV